MKSLYFLSLIIVFTIVVMSGCSSQRNLSSEDVLHDRVNTAMQTDESSKPVVNAEISEKTGEDAGTETEESIAEEIIAENMETDGDLDMKLILTIGSAEFAATLEKNIATDELIERLLEAPLTIDMSDYSGFEKVGSLGFSLPTANHQTTTSVGDIVLYNGNQIVVFYGSNSWSYTKLGQIDDLNGWTAALGNGNVTIEFSIKE